MSAGKAYWGLKFIRNLQTTIIDNTLWMDGGEVLPTAVANFSNSTTEALYQPNPYLFSLDLSQAITISGDGQDNDVDTLYSNGRLKVLQKPSSAGTSAGGALFNYLWSDPSGDTTKFVEFGGRTSSGIKPTDPLYTYDALSGNFDSLPLNVQNDSLSSGYLNPHNGASAQSPDGMAYYLGGMDSNGQYLKQLVKLDLTTGDISVEATGAMPPIVGSQLTWYPIGKKGVLVSIGGESLDSKGRIATMPMSNIWVYDILSATWYSQTATAADKTQGFPLDRKYFCAVAPSFTTAQSSYEFILHGGHRTLSDSVFKLDDIWALTLPTFQWIQYYYGATGLTNGYGGYNVSCAIPNNHYFMVVSTHGFGEDFANYPFAWFDLEGLSWGNYDPTVKGYTPPQIVQSTVSGRKVPDSWDSSALENVFAQAYTSGYQAPVATATSATSSPTSTNTATSSTAPVNNNNSSKSNTAAVAAGASVGAVVFIALCAFVWWFLLRRKNRKQLPDVPYVPTNDGCGRKPASELQGTLNISELPHGQVPVEIDGHYSPQTPEYKAPLRYSSDNIMELPADTR
ncbi:hypothetical protein TWF694_009693 [Orbilia ellipsospora]|uniref:Kelch repeat protein n=1 Tax=Orbilia ellipsospora TaxID=2528407 RepID=A0AAV9XBJ5_9PEZI